jgi:type IV pilus assembly protein PilN
MRPLFAKLRLVMAGLAVLAVGLGFLLHAMNAKAATAEAQMNALKAKTADYQNQRMANEARMRQPQNQAVLARSQFLNNLFAEKSFSWTAVMMDLERVLPVGVQVTSIEPAITKDGSVNIRLRVSGDRERAVQLVRNLETSARFLSPRLASEQAQTQEGANRNVAAMTAPGAVQFDVLSGYNPLPEKKVKSGEDADKSVDKDEEAPKPVVRHKRPAGAGGALKTAPARPGVPAKAGAR